MCKNIGGEGRKRWVKGQGRWRRGRTGGRWVKGQRTWVGWVERWAREGKNREKVGETTGNKEACVGYNKFLPMLSREISVYSHFYLCHTLSSLYSVTII